MLILSCKYRWQIHRTNFFFFSDFKHSHLLSQIPFLPYLWPSCWGGLMNMYLSVIRVTLEPRNEPALLCPHSSLQESIISYCGTFRNTVRSGVPSASHSLSLGGAKAAYCLNRIISTENVFHCIWTNKNR